MLSGFCCYASCFFDLYILRENGKLINLAQIVKDYNGKECHYNKENIKL